MIMKNPWRGLASYEEPQGTSDDYLFCGRDEETLDVVRLIDNNLFITLYGSSGIGKTSLLKAGVMPILKRRDYYPLYVRLSQEPVEISYAEAIVRKLKSSELEEERCIEMEHSDGNDRLFLWNYFATTRFRNAEGREVYPVIILDQFEEVFRDVDKRKVEQLLQQIYLLLNDELEMPNQEGYNDETNYRFVASIREDFLFVLEDSIDEYSMELYKSNRYRLRAMKPEQARRVVLIPGKDCIEESEKARVADHIVALAQSVTQQGVDTLYLSLVCSEVFNIITGQNQKTITKDLIDQLGDNILSSFYESTMQSVNAETVNYLESHLITQSGFRNSIAVEDLLYGGISKKELDYLVEKRLLRREKNNGVEWIEFIHDSICSIAKDSRDKSMKKNRKKTNALHGIGFFFDIFIPFSLLFLYLCHFMMAKGWIGFSAPKTILCCFSTLLVLANATMIIPYRHTHEGNSRWLLLIAFVINLFSFSVLMLCLPFSSPGYDESINQFLSDCFLAFLIFSAIYILTHFFISLSYTKKRRFKDAIRYILNFKLYKERPSFTIILVITIIIMIILVFVLSKTIML